MTNPARIEDIDTGLAFLTDSDAPPWLDWRVFRATKENPGRRVDLTSLRCAGATFSVVLVVISNCDCELIGTVPAAE